MTLTTNRSEALIVAHKDAHRHRGIMDQVDERVEDEHLGFIPPCKYSSEERVDGVEHTGVIVFEFTFEENPKNLYLKSL